MRDTRLSRRWDADPLVSRNAVPRGLPLVTIVIPTYQREHSIERSIHSVLTQGFRDFELIVVDDGSTDDTLGLLRQVNDPRLLVVALRDNRGPSAARNFGIRRARGRYVAFLNSDDTWMSDKLEKQLTFMETHRSAVRLTCTAFRYVDGATGNGADRPTKSQLAYDDFLDGCRCAPGSTLIAETSLFCEVGLLNERLRRLEDWDWLLRATPRSHVGVIQEPLSDVCIRLAGGNLYQLVKEASVEILQAHSDRASRSGRGGWRRLRATIQHELAATCYLDRRYLTAIKHLAAAYCWRPGDTLRQTSRALKRVRSDVSRRFRAEVSGVEVASLEGGPTEARSQSSTACRVGRPLSTRRSC